MRRKIHGCGDRDIKGTGLQSVVCIIEDRNRCNDILIFPWSVCCEKSDQGRSESESNCRWNPDTADGTAANGSRILPALLFSRRRPFGILLYEEFGIKVVQTWAGCIIAATVIAFPLMYRNARAAFEQIDVNLIHAARTLGMPEYKIFWKVAVPSAGPGLVAGTILTFARALGEYGATSMLAGNIPGKTGTISQRIAMVIQDGDYMTAGIWVVIIMLVAFVLIFLMNLVTGRNMKNIRRW